MLDHGNAEGKGLAGAGRCLGNNILPLQKLGNGFRLNGGRIAVTLLFQCLQHGFAEAQTFKRNIHMYLSFCVHNISE